MEFQLPRTRLHGLLLQILLIVGLAMFMIASDFDILSASHGTTDLFQASDALCISASAFVILLFIILVLQLFKGTEQDQQFMGWLAVIGTILLFASKWFSGL